MIQGQTIDTVYPAVDQLISTLKALGNSHLAAILHHRMHQVAWTSGSEALQKLHIVLTKSLASNDPNLPASAKSQIQNVLRVIADSPH